MIPASAVILLLSATFAQAQQVSDCDWKANAENLMEPWEENTRTFSGEKVRVAAIDTVEPAAAAFHLLILSPPYDEVGSRQCKIISRAENTGFPVMFFQAMQASYDPAKGLTLTVPVGLMSEEFSLDQASILKVTLNQSSGDITATLPPGQE